MKRKEFFSSFDIADEPLLARAVLLVRANSHERHLLWADFHGPLEAPFPDRSQWEDENSGFSVQIGSTEGKPVNLSFSFADVYGVPCAFFEIISQMQDEVLLQRFLAAKFPQLRPEPANGEPATIIEADQFSSLMQNLSWFQEKGRAAPEAPRHSRLARKNR